MLQPSATIVTAFFDISRETKGDGRRLEEYMEWIKRTLQLNCHLYIITEPRFIDFMKAARPIEYHQKTIFKTDTLENAMYYKYLPRMREIIESSEYKARIMHPDRVECKMPEYNVIQYSKFGWLLDAIQENPFQSDLFFWMDIGISRFFENMDLSVAYPNPLSLDRLCLANNNSDGFIIQKRHDLESFNIDEDFIWRSDNLLKGGMFGGTELCIRRMTKKIEQVFQEQMMARGCVNNEQVALSLIYKEHHDWFNLVDDNDRKPCKLLSLLSLSLLSLKKSDNYIQDYEINNNNKNNNNNINYLETYNVIYSYTVHENIESVIDMLKNLFYFNKLINIFVIINSNNALYNLLNQEIEKLYFKNFVKLHPEPFDKKTYSYDILDAHVKNIKYCSDNNIISKYFITQSSHSLFWKHIDMDYIEQLINARNKLDDETNKNVIGWWDRVDENIINKLDEFDYLHTKHETTEQTQHEGMIIEYKYMKKIQVFLDKYMREYIINSKYYIDFSYEEILLQSIYKKLSNLYPVHLCKMFWKLPNYTPTKDDIINQDLPCVKRICRDYNNPIRAWIRNTNDEYI